MKTDHIQSCGHCWVFQICCILSAALSQHHLLGFEIAQLEFPLQSPQALFVVMLPKAHLTSHSRMSDSRWVVTQSWLSGPWRSFLYSSVYSCHLFSIDSFSVRSMPFLFFIVPIISWNVPLASLICFKKIRVIRVMVASYNDFRSVHYSEFFFFFWIISEGWVLTLLWVFGRIHLWSHLVMDFLFVWSF